MIFRPWVSLLGILLQPSFASAQSCYYPNGNSSPNDIPCFSGSEEGPCCPQGWKCLSNGLCNLPDQNYLGRYTCTDKTWKSSACPELCTQGNTAAGDEAILECSKGNYCCDTNRPDVGCCDTTRERFQLPDGHVVGSMDSPSPVVTGQASSTNLPQISSTQLQISSTQPQISSTQPQISSTQPASSTTTSDSQTQISSTGAVLFKTDQASTDHGTSLVLVTSVITKASGSSSLFVTSLAESATAPQATDAKATDASHDGHRLAVILGPAVGIPVVLIACTLLGLLIWRRKQRRIPRSGSFKYVNPDELAYMYNAKGDDPANPAKTAHPTFLRKITGGLFPNRTSELPGSMSSPGPTELSGDSPSQKHDLDPRHLSELPGSEAFPSSPIQGPDPTKAYREKSSK